MSDWDMMGKAAEVQEAAAEAILAERERFERLLEQGLRNDGISVDQERLDSMNPYPSDPYTISEITQVPSRYLWLADRDPAELPGKKDTMEAVAKDLATTLPDGIGNLQSLLSENRTFTGHVPDRFARYLDNMVDVAENQGALATELATAVTNMYDLLTAAGDDMYSISDGAITALNDIRDGGGGTGAEMGFAILGAVIGVASAASGGTAAIAWALLSGAVSVTGTAATSDPVSSPTVPGVLNAMFDEIADRVEKFVEREDKLVAALDDDNGFADANRYKLDPDTEKSNMYNGPGDTGAAETAVALDLSDTFRYATQAVPRLADQFGTASTQIGTAVGVGSGAMGLASTPWETLCTKLQGYSARTSNHLNEGGENLAKAVQDFARQDGVNAAWVDKTVADVEHVQVPGPYTPPSAYPWLAPS